MLGGVYPFMNRRQFLVIGSAVAAGLIVGAGAWWYLSGRKYEKIPSPGAKKVILRLYTWEEEIYPDEPIVIDDNEFDTITGAFEYLNPNISVIPAYYGDQDRMTAELLAGRKADVIAPCVDYIPVLIRHKLIQKIDTSLLENWDKLFDIFHNITGVKFNGDVYFSPSNYGTEAIDYLRSAFKKYDLKEPTSWHDFFHPEELGFDKLSNPRRILMPDDAKIGIAMAALALGYDLDSDKDGLWELTDTQLENVKELLIHQKKYVLKYSEEIDSELPTLMANGDVFMSLGWAPETLEMTSEGIDAVYLIPEEGPLVFLCGNAITSTTEFYEEAHKLVDFYLSEYVQGQVFAEQYWYGITNAEVVDKLKAEDPELVENLLLDKPEEALSKGHFEYPLDEGEEDRWTRIWNKVLEA